MEIDGKLVVNRRLSDPTVNNDETENYGGFRIWVNILAKRFYISLIQTTGAAQWTQVSPIPSQQTGTLTLDDGVTFESADYVADIITATLIQVYINIPNTNLNAGNINLTNVTPALPFTAPTTVVMGAKGFIHFSYLGPQ